MRKIFTFIVAVAVAISTLSASAKTLKFVTDEVGSGLVSIQVPDQSGNYYPVSLSTTPYEISVNEGAYIPVSTDDGWYLGSIDGVNYKYTYTQKKNADTLVSSMFQDGETVSILVTDGSNFVSKTFTINGEPGSYYLSSWMTGDLYPDENGILTQEYTDPYSFSVYVTDTSKWYLNSISASDGTEIPAYGSYGSISLYQFEAISNPVFNLNLTELDPESMPKFTVSVVGSDYKVKMYDLVNYTTLSLSNDPTVVPFMQEVSYTIESNYYGQSLYKVTVNDEILPDSWGRWSYTPTDGDEVVIYADFPDVDVPLNFNFSGNASESIVASFQRNGQYVQASEWNAPGYSVKLGDAIAISLNTADYMNVSLSVNGEPIESNYYSFTVSTEDACTFDIYGETIMPYHVEIVCEYPEHLTLYKGWTEETYSPEFVESVASFDVSRSNSGVRFVMDGDYFIQGLTVNGSPVEDFSDIYYVESDCTIELDVILLDRSNIGVVYLDPEAEWYYTSLALSPYSSTRRMVELSAGYNVFNFGDFDLPFAVSATTTNYAPGVAYLNDALLEANYGQYQGLENFADGSVLKFFAAEVEPIEINYELAEDVPASVFHDHISFIEEPGSHTVLPGTIVHVKPVALFDDEVLNPLAVKVNGETLEPDADGNYSFFVTKATNVSIANSVEVGVGAITTDDAPADIYNLQGLKVNASTLPAGIYIMNGKKVIIK